MSIEICDIVRMHGLTSLGDIYLASIVTNDPFSWVALISKVICQVSTAYNNLLNNNLSSPNSSWEGVGGDCSFGPSSFFWGQE